MQSLSADSSQLAAETAAASQIEYAQANEWWRHVSRMRRQDLAMFTAIQGAALGLIAARLTALTLADTMLSAIAFMVALVGMNNERSLNYFLGAVWKRAVFIERASGISLLTAGSNALENAPWFVRTHSAFMPYYLIIILGWILVWLINFEPHIRNLIGHSVNL